MSSINKSNHYGPSSSCSALEDNTVYKYRFGKLEEKKELSDLWNEYSTAKQQYRELKKDFKKTQEEKKEVQSKYSTLSREFENAQKEINVAQVNIDRFTHTTWAGYFVSTLDFSSKASLVQKAVVKVLGCFFDFDSAKKNYSELNKTKLKWEKKQSDISSERNPLRDKLNEFEKNKEEFNKESGRYHNKKKLPYFIGLKILEIKEHLGGLDAFNNLPKFNQEIMESPYGKISPKEFTAPLMRAKENSENDCLVIKVSVPATSNEPFESKYDDKNSKGEIDYCDEYGKLTAEIKNLITSALTPPKAKEGEKLETRVYAVFNMIPYTGAIYAGKPDYA